MRSCPHCRLMLEETDFHGRPLWCCRSCGGAWIAGADAMPILVESRARLDELDAVFAGVASSGIYEGLSLPCPQCAGRSLEESPVSGVPGVTAPVCPVCGGVWLTAAARRDLVGAAPAAPEPSVAPEPAEAPAAPAPPASPASLSEEVEAAPPDARLLPQTLAQQALDILLAGNQRFAEGTTHAPNRSVEHRIAVSTGQKPLAAVVCCSDSRVPPEIVFDQGLGDLFVVRSAGQALGDEGELSLQLAVDHFDVPLIMVLGHSQCGAVKATIAGEERDRYLGAIIDAITPAVEAVRYATGDLVENVGRANVQNVVRDIRELAPIIAPRVDDGQLGVVGAYYDLATGRVTVLPDPEPHRPESPPAERVDPSPLDAGPVTSQNLDITTVLPVPPPIATEEPRLCPRCLHTYPAGTRTCERCSVPLMAPNDTAPCPRCSVHNLIPVERCRACGIDLRSPEAIEVMYPLPGHHTPIQRAEVAPVDETPDDRRWCPHCRRPYRSPISFCTQCGIALVRGVHLVACSHCRSLNPISSDRCRACTADLHPGADRMPPPVPDSPLDLREMQRTWKTGGSAGCTSSTLVLLALALAAIASHALAGR